MFRKLLTLCAFGSLRRLSYARADPLLDEVSLQQTVLNGLPVVNASQEPTPFRVAVIGAGAAGSSSAWWLHLASERLGQPIEVEVFERADYIGGRKWQPLSHRLLLSPKYR